MNRSTPSSEDETSGNTLPPGLQRALEQRPAVTIPADFASRVARLAAAQPAAPASHWPGWGARLALASGALVTAALFALAPHTPATLTSIRFDTELLLFAELGALVLFSHRLLQRD